MNNSSAPKHFSVLLKEVIDYLAPVGGVFLDGTFGAGGYTRAILEHNLNNRVIAFDRDPNALKTARGFEEMYAGRFAFVHDCFGAMESHIDEALDGIVLDLGVSSMQIDEPERGFSLRFDGPLDMRMSGDGLSAKDVVNGFDEREIADILFTYGEEKHSRRIARAIVEARKKQPILTTKMLADIVHSVMPRPKDGSDSATRSFQALRIFVNDELGELRRALDASVRLLKPGGRLVVVSFHSLEDRIVKNFLIHYSSLRPNGNRHFVESVPVGENLFQVLTKKPVLPGEEELSLNSRSHSARLRAGVRLDNKGAK